jgi:hypothetical protein
MIAAMDPRLVIWDEQMLFCGDEQYLSILELLRSHLRCLLERRGRLALYTGLGDELMAHIPFKFCREIKEIEYLSRFLRGFLSKNHDIIWLVPKDDCMMQCVKVTPEEIYKCLEHDEQSAFCGLLREMARSDFCPCYILSHEFCGACISYAVVISPEPSGEAFEAKVRIVKNTVDWDDVDLETENVDHLEECADALARRRGYDSLGKKPLRLEASQSFREDVQDRTDNRVSFEDIVGPLAQIRHHMNSKGLHREKVSEKTGEWRCYVNRYRGDRLHYLQVDDRIVVRRYYDPGEHDEFMMRE